MFTGIVTDVGKIEAISGDTDLRYTFATSFDMQTVDIGASIACGGVCLTVVDKSVGHFSVDVSQETLKVTNLGTCRPGSEVNLERALKIGDELGGHIVTGHVDCLGLILSMNTVGDSVEMRVGIPAEYRHLVAQKGSITVDGTSLTVNTVTDGAQSTVFSINLIPHTQAVTSFRNSKAGDRVNIEFDILARYVARLQIKG